MSQSVSSSSILDEDLHSIYYAVAERELFECSNILLTGAAGFLGYMFLNFFCRFSDELGIRNVIVLDSFIVGRPKWLDNLMRSQKILKVYTLNVANSDISSIQDAASADFVIHMASIASPPFYRLHPLETVDANVWGLRYLLDFYRDKKLRGFLFFSSSEIYGDPPPELVPTPEGYRGNVACVGPRACYDESKRFGETLCDIFYKQYGMPIGIARPFNNYGPGMRLKDKRAPADFAKAILENSSINIHSDGSPRRTFCYVSDAISGYLKILLRGHGDVFNIGMDKPELSVRELAEIFAEVGTSEFGYTGDGVRLVRSPDREYLVDNPSRRCPLITKARNKLAFNPSIQIETGIRRFLYFLSENEDAR